MAQTWKDTDISLDPIKDQTIAVIGYGIQGDAQANNMKDSGLNVVIGLKEGGNSWKKAEADGHKVMSVADATKQADIIHILIPDMIQGQVYKDEIGPNLSEGKALSFSHAAAIYWKWIEAPNNVDLIMIAPKGPGSKVRETYLDNFGTPSIVAVEQDFTGKAWDRTLGIAKAIGSARAGLIKTAFKEEVETLILITSALNLFPANSNDVLVLVLFSKNRLITVFPNPVRQQANFKLATSGYENSRIRITDIHGKIIVELPVTDVKGAPGTSRASLFLFRANNEEYFRTCHPDSLRDVGRRGRRF